MQTEAGQRFTPLALETRSAIPTDAAAHHLNRKPQTLRSWACLENGAIRPIRINGRLAWRVADIKAVLNGEAA
jgi:hypothetical protein